MTTEKIITSYYENYDEEGRLSSKKTGQVEFLTTMRYIEKYLTSGAKVLEIGAGTGQYSRMIADMGYQVDALELVSHNIEIFKKAMNSEQNIKITQGNALDLSMYEDNQFDITLLFGPLYHLYTEEDKHKAISEAIRVTKIGGIIFTAYCISDGSIIDVGFQRKALDINDYIKRGKINPETFDTFSESEDIFELVRRQDIDRLMACYPVERLHYVATDMLTKMMRDTIDAMDDETFALYLKYHYAICEREDMVGVTHHSLDIMRKMIN